MKEQNGTSPAQNLWKDANGMKWSWLREKKEKEGAHKRMNSSEVF